MLQLHYFPGNASLIAHIVLEEIGVPFELRVRRPRAGRAQVGRLPGAQSERAHPGACRPRPRRRRRRAARAVRDRGDLHAPGRHPSRRRPAAGARHARARRRVQVARLVRQHAAVGADRLLLSRALGRRRAPARPPSRRTPSADRRAGGADRRAARTPRRPVAPRRRATASSTRTRSCSAAGRAASAGPRAACRTSGPGSSACWRGRRCNARSRASSWRRRSSEPCRSRTRRAAAPFLY